MSQLLALSVVLVAAGQPEACREPPRIASSVVALHGPVSEQTSYRRAEVQELARRSGLPLRHEPLGFYIGGFGQEILIDSERRTSTDGTRCDYLTTVTVRIYLINRLIEIASDLEVYRCKPEAVLQHYRMHAIADDMVLSRYVQPLNDALREAWPRMESKLGQSGNNDIPGLRVAVQKLLEEVLRDYDPARAGALAAVDNPKEIENLACGSRT